MSPMPNFSDDEGTPENSPAKTKVPFKIPDNLPKTFQVNGNKFPSKSNNSLDNNIAPSPLDNKTSVQDFETSTDQSDQLVASSNSTDNSTQDAIKSTSDNIADSTELGLELTESSSADLKRQSSIEGSSKKNLQRDNSTEMIPENNVMHANMMQLSQIKTETCGFPLMIFKQGYLCLPYLSLPYLDLLNDINVRGYMIGATNILFKQKRQLYDILVDIEASRIECQDLELRKQLHLTTEDLRFADYIVKHVSEEKHDVFLDGVGWEGGDEWIRAQFKIYLLCIMRTSLLQGMFIKCIICNR